MLSKIANAAGLSAFGSMLDQAYDRSGENIQVHQAIRYDGGQKAINGPMRSWMHERPSVGFLPPQYYVPDDPGITPWRIIKDVSRRYPELTLQVRPYGFPFGADSTLVFCQRQ